MKNTELRIGNHVKSIDCGGDLMETVVTEIQQNHTVVDNGWFVDSPIPLTEDWLVKFGFISNPYQDRYELNEIHIDCDKTKGRLQLWESQTSVILETVHQLQNLYFALTGEELEITSK